MNKIRPGSRTGSDAVMERHPEAKTRDFEVVTHTDDTNQRPDLKSGHRQLGSPRINEKINSVFA
jgi:hypothetical protein